MHIIVIGNYSACPGSERSTSAETFYNSRHKRDNVRANSQSGIKWHITYLIFQPQHFYDLKIRYSTISLSMDRFKSWFALSQCCCSVDVLLWKEIMSALETSVNVYWWHISPALYHNLTVYGRTTVQAFNIRISSVADLYNNSNGTRLDTVW